MWSNCVVIVSPVESMLSLNLGCTSKTILQVKHKSELSTNYEFRSDQIHAKTMLKVKRRQKAKQGNMDGLSRLKVKIR